jgi:methyl-accepting chemotaxis protein
MTIRRHALSGLTVLVALTLAAMTYASTQLFAGFTSDIEQGQFDLMQATVESKLRVTEGRAASRAALIADIPSVRRLFAARDRAGLEAELHDVWTTQHDQYGAAVMQFHTPPGVSFLRLHHPELFGDDLTTYRPLVVAVNADHAPHSSAALSRTGPSVTSIVPVLDPSGAYAGSFEVGMDYGPVLDDLDASYGLVSALFVLEAPLRSISTSMDASLLDDEHRVGAYMVVASTNAELTRSLVTGSDLTHVEEPTHYVRQTTGAPYGVLLYPVRTASGDLIGVISVARDFSATRAATGRSRVWQALLALLAMVVLWGGVLVVVRGMLLSPVMLIAERLRQVARGEASEPIPDADKLPAEIRALADAHEALRTKDADK